MNSYKVGIDLGNKQTKIWTAQGPLVLPSKLINATLAGIDQAQSALAQHSDKDHIFKMKRANEASAYWWGSNLNQLHSDDTILESRGGELRYGTPMYRRLVEFALALAVRQLGIDPEVPVELNVMTGLPTSDFLRSDNKMVDAVERAFVGMHTVLIDGQTYIFKVPENGLSIIPQPKGTLYNLALDDSGDIKMPNLLSEKVGVIDIGGGTLILNEFLNFALNKNMDDTTDMGAQQLYSLVKSRMNDNASLDRIERTLRNPQDGHYIYNFSSAYSQNIDEAFTIAREAWEEQIINEILTQFGDYQSYDTLLTTGGGANLLDKRVMEDSIPNIQFVANSETANVHGFYKALVLTERAKG